MFLIEQNILCHAILWQKKISIYKEIYMIRIN